MDDQEKTKFKSNPRENANAFSILFFTYTIDIFKKGYKRPLTEEDLYFPLKTDQSTFLGDRLERKWISHEEKCSTNFKKPSLAKVLFTTFWKEIFFLAAILLFGQTFMTLQPIMLGRLLLYFNTNSTLTKQEAFWYAFSVVSLNAIASISMNQFTMYASRYGMKVRAACCALIYRKALKISKSALGDTASGKIVNLLANDVSRFDLVAIIFHFLWLAPAVCLVVMVLLYRNAGIAGLLGIIPVFIIVPLQSYTGKLQAKYRKSAALKTDERVRLMDEIISGVQVIKMYAWENPFSNIIRNVRKAELKIIRKSAYVRGLYMTFNLCTTRLALFFSLMAMVLTDQELSASKVFVFMSFYNILSHTGSMFVRGVSEVSEMFVSIKRIESFLVKEDHHSLESTNKSIETKNLVELQNLSVKWHEKDEDFALKNVNLTISHGQLVGIIGLVGSGKSSLLQTILGELIVDSGNIGVNGTVSYASQESWVFAASIRQNIVFGSHYDKTRYDEVIKACALNKDFEQFPDGDLTLVGDRGASLSGGQKARINLARAIYRDADIYLLDDPLSAVDIHVAKHLYEECINGFLSKKTRVLVTHQVYLLKNADTIVILKNGEIEIQGDYNTLSSHEEVHNLLLTEPNEKEHKSNENLKTIKRQISIRSKKSSISSELSIPESLLQDDFEDESDEEELVEEKPLNETVEKKKVKGNLLLRYLSSGGNYILLVFVILLYIFTQILASSNDFFVSFWLNIEEKRNGELKYYINWSTKLCLYVYAALQLALFLIALTRSVLFYELSMKCSQKLHDTMFSNVINATMRFFDTNPSGRILNRFSKDIGAIDDLLPKLLLDAGQMLLIMIGSIILIFIINYKFIFMAGILSIFFWIWRHIYLKSSLNIKRLEGSLRSPAFTHLNATIQGLTTIRAYGAEKVLRKEFDKHQDCHTSALFTLISTSSAFGFYLDIICMIFITFVTFSFLTFGETMGLNAGEVGLAITQAMTLSGILQWAIRQSAEVSNQLTSAERVLEYKELPQEPQPEAPKKLSSLWPDRGSIQFNDTCLRYDKNMPLVLKHLKLNIQPKEKVGVVGRTGAGKSSLITALFRLAIVEGDIIIDDLNTKDLNLKDLRSRISIIPQEPVLFSGTLRYNLDPFEEHTDEELYKALNDVELKDPHNIINRLENKVMDRGSNYSVGQKQLICLARAIIRNSKILLLDEATANVDPQTDIVIQKTLRTKFEDCTVITVAHRLNTIMDSDKVLVIDAGSVAEFDHPYKLLQDSRTIFYHMVKETGPVMFKQLKNIAKASYTKKQQLT